MTSIFIIYIIGYIISLCIFVFNDIKEDDIYLCDLLGIMLISLLSWVVVVAAIMAVSLQYIQDNCDIIIFKKKSNGNKDK